MNIPDMVIPSDNFQSEKIRNALHHNSAILVKMHGDICDSTHLVLTKESYDLTYGNDEANPNLKLSMPNFLATVLNRNPVLFLGCSLNADRTCSVIQTCAADVHKFALLELPKGTKNVVNSIQPMIQNENGRFLKDFRLRRNRIVGTLNILPIWYPHGMHKEALTAFFTQLKKDLTPSLFGGNGMSVNISKDTKYNPLHKLLGRDDVVKKIVDLLSGKDVSCVWVDGPAGIGKTETCKSAYFALKKKFPDINMPYVDVTGISSLSGFFDSIAKELNIRNSIFVNSEDYSKYLINCITQFFQIVHHQDFI